MKDALKRYADVLYERDMQTLVRQLGNELREAKTENLRRGGGQLFSGAEVRRLNKVNVQHIGRLLTARLQSFRTAFEEAHLTPTAEEFTEIWTAVREEYDQQIKSAARYIRDYLKTRCVSDARLESACAEEIMADAGHEHDRVLADWKVWREQALLQPQGRATRPVLVPESSVYEFHPAIIEVASQLYGDGHYKSAVLESFIRVINEVKERSRVQDRDGDALMNAVFGADKKTPVLKFNTLSSDAERDQHQGIFFLFKGMVGIRNYLAHSNVLLDNPEQAFEYLALASLLMRLLDNSQT